MEKKIEEKLLEKIDADVRSNAELVTKRVNDETDHLREEEVSFYREGLKKETDTYLESELNDLRLHAATESSRARLSAKKKLLELRESLTEQLFGEVREKVKAFVKSDAYRTYLADCLKEAHVSEDGYFEVRQNDVDLMKKVLADAGCHNEVRTAHFAVGGFRYINEKTKSEYSCALAEREKDQRAWFHDHSGFTIREEKK